MNNNPIGIFDSGVGGLTVFSKLHELLPKENYIYFGDTKNVPYGEKSQEEIIKLSKKIIDFFAKQNVKAVIMACNTTSATAYEYIKNDYPFKIYPLIQLAAKKIADLNLNRIGVLATPATVSSKAYTKELKKYSNNIEVFEQPCCQWTQIVEQATQNEKESQEIISKHISDLLAYNPDKIVLGCTHYPYLLPSLVKYANKDKFINPANYFIEYIIKDLKENNMLNNDKTHYTKFIVSKDAEQFKKAAKLFYNITSDIQTRCL